MKKQEISFEELSRSYQQKTVNFIERNKRCAVWLDMGYGKTVSTLVAISNMIRFEINKVLIVAPLKVAKLTWCQESAKWLETKHLKIGRILGDATERFRAVLNLDNYDIAITNYENFTQLVDILYDRWPFDMVVFDEATFLKDRTSSRFQAAKKIMALTERIVELTGTPAPEGLMDLYTQIGLLDGGKRLGKNITAYRNTYFYPGKTRDHVVFDYIPKNGSVDTVMKLVSDLVFSCKSDEVKLPEIMYINSFFDLSKEIMQKYKTFLKESVLDDCVAGSSAILTNKLLQLTSGCLYLDGDDYKWYHDERLDFLESLIESTSNENCIIFYQYTFDEERIRKRFKDLTISGINSQKDIDNWNAGKTKILLLHPASASYGLNLQFGGNVVIWYTLTWSLENYLQANKRLYRPGQTNPVRIYHLLARNTIDEGLYDALTRKEVNLEKIIELAKEGTYGQASKH